MAFLFKWGKKFLLNLWHFISSKVVIIARSSANPIFASFHVNLTMSYLFYCLSIWYWILVWHKALTQRVPCLSVSVSGDSRTRIRLPWVLTSEKRRGEHVLVPGIGWLLKGWWGETSGLKIIMGHVPLGPGMDPKTLFSIWLNSQKYLVSLTYIFSHTYKTNFFLFLRSGNLFLVLEIPTYLFEFPVRIVYSTPKGIGFLFRWCWNIDYK